MVRMVELLNDEKKVEQDRNMVVDDKRQMTEKLQEKETKISILTEHYFEITNQVVAMNHEANQVNTELAKTIDDTGVLKEENEKLRNEVKMLQQHNEVIKRSEESTKRMNEFLNHQRRLNNNTRLGYTEQGELSNQAKQRNVYSNPKLKKPSCHHYGKPGHASNVCRCKIKGIPRNLPKFNGIFYNCYKHGNQAHECRSKLKKPQKKPYMDKYCQN